MIGSSILITYRRQNLYRYDIYFYRDGVMAMGLVRIDKEEKQQSNLSLSLIHMDLATIGMLLSYVSSRCLIMIKIFKVSKQKQDIRRLTLNAKNVIYGARLIYICNICYCFVTLPIWKYTTQKCKHSIVVYVRIFLEYRVVELPIKVVIFIFFVQIRRVWVSLVGPSV